MFKNVQNNIQIYSKIFKYIRINGVLIFMIMNVIFMNLFFFDSDITYIWKFGVL